jgi:transposase
MTAKKNPTQVIKDIKQQTRKLFSADEKIRIVIDGLRGEDTIASIGRKYGIKDSLYYKWSYDLSMGR